MSSHIRVATAADAAALLSIYRPIVETTAISFELEPPSEAEFAEKISKLAETHAWLLMDGPSGPVGYAYGSPHRPRAAYQFAVETSVYIDAVHYGKGYGRALYLALFEELAKKHYHNAYAGISLPNAGSIALHKAVGFQPIGVFREIGFKFDRWHDVSWWQRPIAAEGSE